jgi:VCBS repeat-containing protein
VNVPVLSNDTDPENDTLSVTAVTQGAHGTVVINPDNTVKYSPAADYNGSDNFTYTISDGNGGSATGTVTVTVTAVNDAPTAAADSATVPEDGRVTVSVLANDTDPENDTLSVTAVTQGAHGTVVINPDNTLKYSPVANYNGSDTFTYTISDGHGGSATGTVTVTVTAVNDAPTAVADSTTVAEDGSVNVPVLSNDTDPENDTLSVTAVTQGAHGAVVINPDKTVKYTPVANYNGSDTFTYTISDGNGGTATGTVTVTVTAVNDAPTAVADSTTVAEDGSVNVPVLSNDTDPENDTLSVTAVTQGAHGTVVINPDKTLKYTPVANYNGSDSFTYTISDGHGGSATAAVSITIAPVNDAPVAVNDTASTVAEVAVNVAVLANDVDVDGPSLLVTAVTQGAHGSVAIQPGQTAVTYTPAANWIGPDSFTYTISDGVGGTATATVNVTVQAPPRVSTDLQVLYPFSEGSGTVVHDTSGVGTPLDLTISTPGAATWSAGALRFTATNLAQSAGNATKIITAVQASNALTVEAWIVPTNITQNGPAAIVAISLDKNKRDVTLGQTTSRYEHQLRTSTTNQGGNSLATGTGVVATNLQHVVFTRDSAGNAKTWVNGTLITSGTLSGNLSSWASYKIGIGNELSGGRPWLGTFHLVAVYSRALTAAEIHQNYLAGKDGN